jgi:uncharacterized membrane protein
MSSAADSRNIQEGKFFALISYLGFLCIVSLVLKKENRFALYHAKQGLVIFVFEVGAFILSILPLLGGVIRVGGLIVFILLSLFCIMQVLMNKCSRVPVISDIADNIVI